MSSKLPSMDKLVDKEDGEAGRRMLAADKDEADEDEALVDAAEESGTEEDEAAEVDEYEMDDLRRRADETTAGDPQARRLMRRLVETYEQVRENTVVGQAVQFGAAGARLRASLVFLNTLILVFCLTLVVLALTPLGIAWYPTTFGTTFGVALLGLLPLGTGFAILLLYTKRRFFSGLAVLFALLAFASVTYAGVTAGFTLHRTFTSAGGSPAISDLLGAVSVAVVCLVLFVLQLLVLVQTDLILRNDTMRLYTKAGVAARMRRRGCCGRGGGMPTEHLQFMFKSDKRVLARLRPASSPPPPPPPPETKTSSYANLRGYARI